MKEMDARQSAFVAMMSALGITLSVISLSISPLLSSVGQGGAALDLSHIATFIAAFFGGPYLGAVVGFVGGIYAGYYFGYVLGTIGLLSVIGVPIGKALTGLVAGFLYKKSGLHSGHGHTYLALPLTLLSYIPECVYTVFYFLYVVAIVNGQAMAYMLPIVIPKAWVEITVMSLLMGALAGNPGFREFINRSFSFQELKRTIGK
jgi:LytS/YehU family sensor histidine kinase